MRVLSDPVTSRLLSAVRMQASGVGTPPPRRNLLRSCQGAIVEREGDRDTPGAWPADCSRPYRSAQ